MTDTQTTDLYLLGVPEVYHGSYPNESVYPTRFSKAGEGIWKKMFGPDFKQLLKGKSVEDAWTFAVKNFLASCRKNAVQPFVLNGDQVNNRIRAMLKMQRMRLVKYLDRADLLQGITIKGIDRILHKKSNGFSLVVKAKLSLKKWGSKAELLEHILDKKLSFIRTGNGEYEHSINPSCKVVLNMKGSIPTVRYEISVSEQPFIGGMSIKNLTKEKYGKFVFDKIWKPIVNTIPCRTATGPCKF